MNSFISKSFIFSNMKLITVLEYHVYSNSKYQLFNKNQYKKLSSTNKTGRINLHIIQPVFLNEYDDYVNYDIHIFRRILLSKNPHYKQNTESFINISHELMDMTNVGYYDYACEKLKDNIQSLNFYIDPLATNMHNYDILVGSYQFFYNNKKLIDRKIQDNDTIIRKSIKHNEAEVECEVEWHFVDFFKEYAKLNKKQKNGELMAKACDLISDILKDKQYTIGTLFKIDKNEYTENMINDLTMDIVVNIFYNINHPEQLAIIYRTYMRIGLSTKRMDIGLIYISKFLVFSDTKNLKLLYSNNSTSNYSIMPFQFYGKQDTSEIHDDKTTNDQKRMIEDIIKSMIKIPKKKKINI